MEASSASEAARGGKEDQVMVVVSKVRCGEAKGGGEAPVVVARVVAADEVLAEVEEDSVD